MNAYSVVIFDKQGRDRHFSITADNLDAFILKAIWSQGFDHLHVFEVEV